MRQIKTQVLVWYANQHHGNWHGPAELKAIGRKQMSYESKLEEKCCQQDYGHRLLLTLWLSLILDEET